MKVKDQEVKKVSEGEVQKALKRMKKKKLIGPCTQFENKVSGPVLYSN